MMKKKILIISTLLSLQALSLQTLAFHTPHVYPYLPPHHMPISPKCSITAGTLNTGLALIGIGGIGRFYTGDYGIALAQLLLPIIGQIWSFFDGIHMLREHSTDSHGLLLTSHPKHHWPSLGSIFHH